MGTFAVPIEIGNVDGSRWRSLEAMVDTGAMLTSISQSIWDELGLQGRFRTTFELADGREAEYDVADALVRIDGDERPTLVVAPGEAVTPLLGAYTMEAFFVAPDPVHKRLIPVRGYLL